MIDGKYEIGRVIGSGGMGTVYEATRMGLDRKVALKLLHGKYAKSAKIVKRFHQEARLAGSISHDNICRVTDHGSAEDGAPYLVMPLLTGQSLAKWVESGEKPSQMQIIDVACQTLLALEAAHKEKIVHRDLKPDNIFVTKIGDRDDFVKLLDFGISKVLEQESVSNLTSTGMVLGTAYYLAPEQARGAKHIDHRVDIYAMGVILYEVLTGTRPFEGETYNEVMFKIAGEPFKTPRSLNPSISPAVEQVIIKAMAIDPADRYASALEMCHALEKAAVSSLPPADESLTDTLADTWVEHPSPSPTSERAPEARRRRLIAAALIVVVGVIAAIWLSLGGDQEDLADEPVTAPDDAADDGAAAKKLREAEPPPVAVEAEVPDARPAEPTLETAAPDEKPAPSDAPPPSKKTHKPPRKKRGDDDQMIKGRFGTTFIFEE